VSGPVRLQLRVSPAAARAEVVGRHGGGWKVRVTAPPEAGRANAAVVRLLAGALGVAPSAVEVVAGHGARDKVVALAGLNRAELERRLASAAAGRGKEVR
jgi:uncharacterized protein (TIGR00251 family)